MKAFRYRKIIILVIAVSIALMGGRAVAQATEAPFAGGERLLREDKPAEAAKLLEVAILQPGADEKAWLYLGVAYQMLGRYDDSISTLRKGAQSALRYKALFYFDIGNAYVLQGKNSFAEEMFGQALDLDPAFAPAYLNRANVRLGLANYDGAKADYTTYLTLDPSSAQRAAIEEIMRRLAANIEAAQAAATAAAAQQAAAEAARQALLSQVQASLKASAEETTSLSAGSGQVQGYGDNLELDH